IKPLTGKFGLGFKSVFLVSSKPSILSGRIKFNIVAGLYPLRMNKEDLDHISKILESWGNGTTGEGTLIDLPVDLVEIPNLTTKDVVNDFYQWADLMVVFSHEVNRIELRQDGKIRRTIEWKPEKLIDGCSNWLVGKLQNISAGGRSTPANALVWKTSKSQLSEDELNGKARKDFQGSLLFILSAEGCIPLDPNVPRIWVTAPTEEIYPVGFALNTNFALDVGRAQLARESEDNRLLAKDLGKKFGKSLLDLFCYTRKNWLDFCQKTGLSKSLSEYDFWESVWKTACEPMRQVESREGYELLRIFLDLGFGRLYRNDSALPTGLPGEHKILTNIHDLRFYISGILENSEIFNQVASWPAFQTKVAPGSAIISSVRTTLVRWLSEKPDLVDITLWKIVSWVVGPSEQVTPEQADLLGKVISPSFFKELARNEEEELRQYLKKLKFKTRAGRFFTVTDMLATNIEDIQDFHDEYLRSEFAPHGLVLSSDYTKAGAQFFRASRDKHSATVEKMLGWALEIKEDVRKLAVLNYLLRGELADALTQALLNPNRQTDYKNSWFALISDDHELLQYFSPYDRSIILGRLRIGAIAETLPPKPLPSAEVILEKIYSWWDRNQAALIVDYEQSIYPFGIPVSLSKDMDYVEELAGRREWMILFLLGSYHTIGRVHKKAYRNFIEDCHEKGWLNTFARSDADDSEWIGVLESYLGVITENDDVKYQYLFTRQFVNIYKLSSNLQNYVELFLGIDRIDKRFNLEHLANPNKSELLSGSDFPSIPKLSNTLGIGIGLVIRELVRKEVITSQYAYEHCYSPVSRLRRLFAEMNFNLGEGERLSDSPQIYQFLVKNLGAEKATFKKSFDIPFLVLAEKYENLQAFLDDNR
ncbi:MAG: hypothetical protein WCK35_06430, partial [Chloroflexota bacterium]